MARTRVARRPSTSQTPQPAAGRILAFLDVETTGLSPWFGDRICEVAVARVAGSGSAETFTSLVNPERPISPGAARVNGLTDREVGRAPRFAAVADNVSKLLADAIIVCHNAPFDLSFLDSELQRLGRKLEAPSVLDTLEIARSYYGFPSNSLTSIAADLGLETPQAHRALADVLTTREVFNYFYHDLMRQGLELEELLANYVSPAGPAAEADLPPAMREALASGKRLHLTYVDGNGEKTHRWVTPIQIISLADYFYLSAYCHLRKAERNFRLDRIVELKVE